MRVKDLIKILSQHAASNPNILITWEATWHEIDEDSIYLSADGDLVLDADGNSYKDKITMTPGWLREKEDSR